MRKTEEIHMNDLMNLLKERRTYRRFCQKPISEEILAEILTAARYASGAANKQPLSYVVVKTPQKVQEVFAETKWAAYLPKEQGQPKAGEEPVLFIGVVQNLKINPNCDTDAGLAISNMTLAAWNHGVGSCIIGCMQPQKAFGAVWIDGGQKRIRWWHLVSIPYQQD